MPSFDGVMPKRADGVAMRRSQASARPQPPPTASPSTQAMVGNGKRVRLCCALLIAAWLAASHSASSLLASSSGISAPAQNAPPGCAACTSSRRRSGSAAASASRRGSRCHMASVKALRLSARSISRRAMGPSCSRRRLMARLLARAAPGRACKSPRRNGWPARCGRRSAGRVRRYGVGQRLRRNPAPGRRRHQDRP